MQCFLYLTSCSDLILTSVLIDLITSVNPNVYAMSLRYDNIKGWTQICSWATLKDRWLSWSVSFTTNITPFSTRKLICLWPLPQYQHWPTHIDCYFFFYLRKLNWGSSSKVCYEHGFRDIQFSVVAHRRLQASVKQCGEQCIKVQVSWVLPCASHHIQADVQSVGTAPPPAEPCSGFLSLPDRSYTHTTWGGMTTTHACAHTRTKSEKLALQKKTCSGLCINTNSQLIQW